MQIYVWKKEGLGSDQIQGPSCALARYCLGLKVQTWNIKYAPLIWYVGREGTARLGHTQHLDSQTLEMPGFELGSMLLKNQDTPT